VIAPLIQAGPIHEVRGWCSGKKLVPAEGIEPPTFGLQNLPEFSMAARCALTQELLQKVRQQRDAGVDCQFAIDNPRGLFLRVRNKEAAVSPTTRRADRGIPDLRWSVAPLLKASKRNYHFSD